MKLPTNGAPNDALEDSTYPQEGGEDLKNNSGNDEEDKPQDEWDEQEYKVNFIRFINEEPIIDTTIRIAAGTINKMVEPVYNHRARIKERSRPLRKCDEYRAISVFWEIGGVKAHCLIDSSCEGVMISPEFTQAAKIALEKPISIQLAVTGSKSIINYGTNTTIKINGEELKEYFNVVNIDYYDAILGTPFLKKFKVVIDFAKECLTIKDKIILNQVNEYKIREGNFQKSTSVKALKTDRLGKNLGVDYPLTCHHAVTVTKERRRRK